MISKFWIWLSTLFPKSKIGILFSMLFAKAGTVLVSEILDVENQQIAYAFVVNLSLREDLTNKEKQKIFNQQMLEWAKSLGKKMSESVINCLRELAVNALKAELSKSNSSDTAKA